MLIYRLLYVFLIFTLCISSGLAHKAVRHGVTQTMDEMSESYRDHHDSHESVQSDASGTKRYETKKGRLMIWASANADVKTKEKIKELDEFTTGSYWVLAYVYSMKSNNSDYTNLCGTYTGRIERSAYAASYFRNPAESIDDINVEAHADVYNQTLNPVTGQAWCEVNL